MDDPNQPRFSVLTVVGRGSEEALQASAASLEAQTFASWEWVVCDVAGAAVDLPGPDARVVRPEAQADVDAAFAAALEAASGEFVLVIDPGETLVKRALGWAAESVDENPDADVLYADESETTQDGAQRRIKPDWSPERLRHDWYVGHAAMLRRTLALEVGGFLPGRGASREYDLLLRLVERASDVHHVRRVLSHRRAAAPLTDVEWDRRVGVVQEHLDRRGRGEVAARGHDRGLTRIVREADLESSVSVVIPTIGSAMIVGGESRVLVVEAIRSMVDRSDHRNTEYIVVYDAPTPDDVLASLAVLATELGVSIRTVLFEQPFNFSAKCNLGAAHATGDVLVFLNDDIEAQGDHVIESLIAPLRDEGVGATGPKLVFEDGRIQSAGIQFGSRFIRNRYRLADPEDLGEAGELWIDREATGVTGACLAMRRADFDAVGGFCEDLPVNYNDVDLCLKLLWIGRRILWLHDITLSHFESVTRDRTVHPWELAFMTDRWGSLNLTRERLSSGIR